MLLIFLLYLLLAAPVHGDVLAAANGMRGAARLSARVYGVSIRYDISLSLEESAASAVNESQKAKEGAYSFPAKKKLLKSPLVCAVRRALRLDLIDVRMRVGLEEAWSTALIVGGVRAAMLSLLSCLPPADQAAVEVAPDFTEPCFLVRARCIFSVTPGDIMLAVASAAIKKRRKEGA